MLHSAYACCASCTPLPTSLNSPRSQGRTSIRDDIRKHKPLTSEITSQRKRSDFGFKLAHDLDSSATFSAGLHLMYQTKPRSSHINVRALSGESTAMISRRADRHIYTERTSCRTLINAADPTRPAAATFFPSQKKGSVLQRASSEPSSASSAPNPILT